MRLFIYEFKVFLNNYLVLTHCIANCIAVSWCFMFIMQMLNGVLSVFLLMFMKRLSDLDRPKCGTIQVSLSFV